MTASRSTFRAFGQDRVDYRGLVRAFESHAALRRFQILLGSGGIVMLVIALAAMVAQHEQAGRAGILQGVLEAVVAGVWTCRWWFLSWPSERESLAWILFFDADAIANSAVVHDPVIGVLGLVLLVAMGAYVTVFHSPRVLAVHIGLSLLASVILAVRMFAAAVGISLVLVMFVVIGVMLPFVQFSHWLLRMDALSDPLTRLLNRRGLDCFLPAYLDRGHQRDVYVATIDLDRFKAVNDAFGHHVGDDVLVRTAECLRRAADPEALIARTGGEEFVVVGYLRESAMAVGERLRAAVGTIPCPPTSITASVGVAVLDRTDPDTHDGADVYRSLLRRSDSAMYRAKHIGGNSVVTADERRPTRQQPGPAARCRKGVPT